MVTIFNKEALKIRVTKLYTSKMSTFFGASSRNRELKWIVTIDDTKAKSGFQNLKRGFTELDTTVKGTSKNLGTTTQQQFQAMDQDFKKTAQSLKQFEAEIKKAETQQTSFGSKLKNNIQNFSTFGIGISTTINSATMLARSYRDLEDTQIAVDRTALKMSRTEEAAAKAKTKLDELTQKGIRSGAEYEQALLDIQQTEEAATLATQMHGEALESQGDTYMNFAQSLIPTVIASVSTAGTAFKDLNLNLGKLKGGFNSTGVSLSDFGGKLGTLGLGAAAVAATAVIANQINVLNNYRIANEKIAESIRTNNWEGVLQGRLQGLRGEFDNVFGQAASTLRNSLPQWMRNADAESREAEKIFLENRENFRTELGEFMKSPEWIEVMKLNPKVRTSIQTEINTLTSLLDPKNFDKNVTDPDTGKFSEWYAQTWLDAVAKSLGIIQDKLPGVLADAPKILDSLNRALVYQEQYMSDVTSQADEYVRGINEAGGVNMEMSRSALLNNRALDYQRQHMPTITSQADEYANSLTEVNEITTVYNRALAYQQQNLPKITSQADEYAHGINEIGTTTSAATVAYETWRRSVDHGIGSVDEFIARAKYLDQVKKTYRDFFADMKFPNLESALDITTDKDKITDKILDYMPDHVEKDIEVELKTNAKLDIAQDVFEETLALAANNIDYSDADMDAVVEGAMKYLKEKFPNSPEAQNMRKELANTVGGEDTKEKVKNLIAKWSGITVPIEGDVTTLKGAGQTTVPSRFGGATTMSEFIMGSATKPVASVPLQGVITKVEDGYGPGGAWPGRWSKETYMKLSYDGDRPPVPQNKDDLSKALNAAGFGRSQITVTNTIAIKAVDVVAKRIASLSAIDAMISLKNTTAIKAVDVTANRIQSLQNIEPQISLQNKQAIKASDVVAKRIEGLEKIEPVITVKFTGSGKISGSASGSIRVAQHGMHEILSEDTVIYAHQGEAVHIDRASGGYNSSSAGHLASGEGGRRPIVIENHMHMLDREYIRTLKYELGKGRSQFGA